MLRASCRTNEIPLQIQVVADPSVDCGIPHYRELIEFANALVAGSPAELDEARATLFTAVGDHGVIRAAAVVGNFQMMNRALGTIGATLGEKLPLPLRELADELGVTPPAHWS